MQKAAPARLAHDDARDDIVRHIFGDVDVAVAIQPVDLLRPGDGRAAFAEMLADTAFEIADFARELAMFEGVPVAFRRPPRFLACCTEAAEEGA